MEIKMAFEKYILPDNEDTPKMAVHLFRGIVQEYIDGQKTKTECLEGIEEDLGVELTNDEKSDLNALMVAIDGEGTVPEKMAIADDTYRVCVIAESGLSWYDTKAKLKARLSWI